MNSTEAFLIRIAEDQSCWHQEGFDSFPSMIAHEYWRLRELCRQDKPYGVLFEIKDVYEVTLKFSVLLACARGRETKDDEFLDEVVCLITEPKLSMGDWQAIGEKAIGYYERSGRKGTVICSLLHEIIAFFREQNVVYWRNDKIGHGALGFAEDEDFRQDVIGQIRKIRKLFEKIHPQILQIRVISGNDILQGYQKARKVTAGEHLRVEIGQEEISFLLDPFVELLDNTRSPENSKEIFLFDSQNQRNKKVTLQSFASGSKDKKTEAVFSELSERRRAGKEPRLGYSVDSKGITMQEETVINSMEYSITDFEFVKPDLLIDWLKGNTERDKQGIYLLEMSRGTGKSTFCAKLNTRYRDPVIISRNLDVRTYHIHRIQLTGTEDFEREIELQWSYSYDGSLLTRCDRIVDYRNRGMNRADAFIAFLTQYRDIARQFRHKTSILMVLDGIDEIRSNEIWQYLDFTGKNLPEGVYILATCRPQDDFPDGENAELRQNIEKLNASETKIIGREAEENRRFLESYTENNVTTKLSEEDKEALFALAEYRVINLSMLCTLINSGVSVETLLKKDGNVIGFYLDMLYARYGETQKNCLQEILIVLSSFGEIMALTMKDIAELTGNDGIVTIEMLGLISDISAILKKEYGYIVDKVYYQGENRYHIVNGEIAGILRRSIPYADEYIAGCAETAADNIRNCLSTGKEADSVIWLSLMVLAGIFRILPDEKLKTVIGNEQDWMAFALETGETLLEKADVMNLKWINQLIIGSEDYLQRNNITMTREEMYREKTLLARAALNKGEAETALAWIEQAEKSVSSEDEHNELYLHLLRTEATIITPMKVLEGEALLTGNMERYRKYSDLCIRANMLLLKVYDRRSDVYIPGTDIITPITSVNSISAVILAISKNEELLEKDRSAFRKLLDEYLCEKYQKSYIRPWMPWEKNAFRKKLNLLCTLTLNEPLQDEEEQIIRMSVQSKFIAQYFGTMNYGAAYQYLGKEKTEDIRTRIIDCYMQRDNEGILTDRSVLGQMIIRYAEYYAEKKRVNEINLNYLYRGVSIYTGQINKGSKQKQDYENLCFCRYMITETELAQRGGADRADEEIRIKKQEAVQRRLEEIRSIHERVHGKRIIFGAEEGEKLGKIRYLQNSYGEILNTEQREELRALKRGTWKDRLIIDKFSMISAVVMLILVYFICRGQNERTLNFVLAVLAIVYGILSFVNGYFTTRSRLKKLTQDKRLTHHLILESLPYQIIVNLIMILFGILMFLVLYCPGAETFFSQSWMLFAKQSIQLRLLLISILISLAITEIRMARYSVNLFRAGLRIRKLSRRLS